ncbi:MAG: acylphosphatase [Thermoplasmatales archaeon]|nr:acylphosphatase [Thermoplasmatales archaeon]
MIRAKIIVKGKVQRVRYRSKVKEIADNMGIVGEAENLKDNSVLIIAEGEKKVINDFINRIKIKNRLIDVQDVSVDFEDATGEFTKFKKVISGTMLDVAERMDDAADHLEKLIRVVENGNKKTEGVGEKVDNLTTQTNQNFKDLKGSVNSVGEKVDNLTTQTNQNFKDLKGSVNNLTTQTNQNFKDLKGSVKEVKESVNGLATQTNQHFTDMKGSYHTFSERMLSMEEKLTKLVEYIGMLVKNHIEKEEKERKTRAGKS